MNHTKQRCPVCRARFRQTHICSRCGADLTAIMKIALDAWRCRQKAIRALAQRDPTAATAFAQRARELHDTPKARRLQTVARLLIEIQQS